MRAVRGQDGKPLLVDVDEPPGEGETLTIQVVGICASDFLYLRLGTNFVLGHEVAGVRADGTAVAVEGQFGCGRCEFCLEGRNNLCHQAAKKALGIGQDGGMVERFRVPSHKLVDLPPGLDLADASLVEPASVAWHGARLGGAGPGKRVAVVGGGSIGLLAAAAAQTQGADDVALQARYPHQHEIRERLGVAEPESGGHYDVVLEAAGSPSALSEAAELLRPGGTIAILGVHRGPLDLPYEVLLSKEIQIVASRGYCSHGGRREMQQAAEMLASRPEIPASLITHRFPLDDAPEAFRVASERGSGAVKVVVEVA